VRTTSYLSDAPETYYVGAYWGPRKEPPEECARRTAELLRLLVGCDPLLAEWYKPTKRLKDARNFPLMPPDVATFTEMFRRGVNREKGGPIIEDLGFRVVFSNARPQHDYTSLSIKCGDYCGATPNSCLLSLPTPGYGTTAERVITASVLTGVVRAMALAYEPDWAVATSHLHRSLLSEQKVWAGEFVGWVTYHSRGRGALPPLPAPARIEPVEDKGSLIVLMEERLTGRTPEHVERALRVGEVLASAGCMQPVIAPWEYPTPLTERPPR